MGDAYTNNILTQNIYWIDWTQKWNSVKLKPKRGTPIQQNLVMISEILLNLTGSILNYKAGIPIAPVYAIYFSVDEYSIPELVVPKLSNYFVPSD